MNRFDENATLQDVLDEKQLKGYSEYFYFEFPQEICGKRIDDLSWYARDAINWLYEKKIQGKVSIHHFDPHQSDVNLIHVSYGRRTGFALIVSGGGLICIDTAHEGIPIGKELYDRGYDVFFLTYRLRKRARRDNATKDLHHAMAYIKEHADEFQIDLNDFLLIGGSAGAYIAASYCTNNLGYIKYGNPKPKALCLLYPVVEFHGEEKNIKEIVLGKEPSRYLLDKYSVPNHVKGTFPPTFLLHCKDDDCVPYQQSETLYRSLLKNGIQSELHLFEFGKHGWGIGKKLEPEGWLDAFLKFQEKL